MDIFDSSDCATFMSYALKGERDRVKRGELSKLAEHMACHVSYLSQVLKGERHCSLEQGLRFCQWKNLSEIQTQFFMAQLSYERAGTQSLKLYYKNAKDEIKRKATRIKEQVETKMLDGDSIFFSSLRLQLIHAMTQLEKVNTLQEFSNFSGWDEGQISESLQTLKSLGLVKEAKPGSWQATHNFLHIDRSQTGYSQFHQNWRNYSLTQFLLNSSRETGSDFNMSSLVITDPEVASFISRALTTLIKDISPAVRDSQSQQVYYLGIDFTQVQKPW